MTPRPAIRGLRREHVDAELSLGLVIRTDEHALGAGLVKHRRCAYRRPCRARSRYTFEQHDVTAGFGHAHFLGHARLRVVDAIHEVAMIVVLHERVAATRDHLRAGLDAFAARLRDVALRLDLIAEHARERSGAFDTRPQPFARRWWSPLDSTMKKLCTPGLISPGSASAGMTLGFQKKLMSPRSRTSTMSNRDVHRPHGNSGIRQLAVMPNQAVTLQAGVGSIASASYMRATSITVE